MFRFFLVVVQGDDDDDDVGGGIWGVGKDGDVVVYGWRRQRRIDGCVSWCRNIKKSHTSFFFFVLAGNPVTKSLRHFACDFVDRLGKEMVMLGGGYVNNAGMDGME